MKTVKIIEGKPYLVKEIKASNSIEKRKRFSLSKSITLRVLEERMQHCIQGLEEAMCKGLIVHNQNASDSSVIYYCFKDKIRHFSVRTYDLMANLREKIIAFPKENLYSDFLSSLNIIEIQQLLKAYERTEEIEEDMYDTLDFLHEVYAMIIFQTKPGEEL